MVEISFWAGLLSTRVKIKTPCISSSHRVPVQGFCVDPFLVNLFAAIHVNIPGCWHALMVGHNLAFDVIFPQRIIHQKYLV